jgi:hypothetical protein
MPSVDRYQTASQSALPPAPDLLLDIDPLARERTRFNDASRTHRYTLFRHWGDPENYVAFVGMNPSGADEEAIDRTIGVCLRLARKWRWKGQGFGAMYMLNAFALRATHPEELVAAADPVGRDNDHWIRAVAGSARLIVPAWGDLGALSARGMDVADLLRVTCRPEDVRCFWLNRGGSPSHPLYKPESITPDQMEPFFDTGRVVQRPFQPSTA